MPAAALFLFSLLLATWTAPSRAELVLVANPKSGVERLTRGEAVNIFLGRYRQLPSGIAAEPVDIEGDGELKARFYRGLVGKSLAEINAYWARLVFSGKTQPPLSVIDTEEALRRVASRVGALAYLDRGRVDRRVVVVMELDD